MQAQTQERRVERLAIRMTSMESLAEQLATQVAGLTTDVSSLKEDTRAIREEMRDMRSEMRDGFKELRDAIAESRDHARMLFEDVVKRIALLDEAGATRKRKRQG